MKALHVIQELRRGGAETVVLELTNGLRRDGHQVGIAAADGPWAGAFGQPVFSMPMVRRQPLQLLNAAKSLDAAIKAHKPDVIHAHNPVMGMVTSLATVRGHRVPSLVTLHGVPENDYASTAKLLRTAGLHTVACGPGVAEALTAAGGRVHETIVNGVSPAAISPAAAVTRDELGVPAGDKLVLSIGRLTPQKRHDRALRLLAGLDHAVLAIVGEGPERARLEALATDLGVSTRTRFTGVRDDVRTVMSSADLLVMLSDWEGLPLTLLEGMAAGLPVVVSDVRGLREMITDGVNGLVVPPDDTARHVAAAQRVLSDASHGQHLSAAGRTTSAQFSVDAMMDAYVRTYERLLRCRGR